MIRKFKKDDAKECSRILLDCIRIDLTSLSKENRDFMVKVSQSETLIKKSMEVEFFVLEKEGKIVGTGAFDNGEIRTMFVDSKLQGKGFGKEMLEFLIKYAKEKNFAKVFLKSSLEAEKFYESQGFKKTGENNDFNFRVILREKEVL